MQLPRRRFLCLAAAAATLPALSRNARAQPYPVRPVRWIVPFPPGGVGDIVSRLMGEFLSERLDRPFIIENRPGAATNLATEIVVHAPPDGYSLLFVGQPAAINATLYDKLNFNFIRDIAPVAGMMRVPNAMLVNPSVPARTVPEFIAHAKAHRGEINFSSGGIGTTSHMAGELFKMMTGINIVHVPYRGDAPALTGLLGGQVQVYFGNIASSIEHVRAGKLRALAVTTSARAQSLPDLPTMADFISGYEVSTWTGVAVPKNTPAHIIDKLNEGINAGLADVRVKRQFAELGGTVLAGSPDDFGKLIALETEKWARVVKFSGAKSY